MPRTLVVGCWVVLVHRRRVLGSAPVYIAALLRTGYRRGTTAFTGSLVCTILYSVYYTLLYHLTEQIPEMGGTAMPQSGALVLF